MIQDISVLKEDKFFKINVVDKLDESLNSAIEFVNCLDECGS